MLSDRSLLVSVLMIGVLEIWELSYDHFVIVILA